MFCGRSLPYKYYINAHNRDFFVFVGFSQFQTEKLHHVEWTVSSLASVSLLGRNHRFARFSLAGALVGNDS